MHRKRVASVPTTYIPTKVFEIGECSKQELQQQRARQRRQRRQPNCVGHTEHIDPSWIGEFHHLHNTEFACENTGERTACVLCTTTVYIALCLKFSAKDEQRMTGNVHIKRALMSAVSMGRTNAIEALEKSRQKRSQDLFFFKTSKLAAPAGSKRRMQFFPKDASRLRRAHRAQCK